MNRVFKALKQALESCLDPRILFLLFVPFLLSLLIGLLLFFTLGTLWVASVAGGVEQSWIMELFSQKWQILTEGMVSSIAYMLSLMLALLVILPLSYLLAVLLVSMVLLPFILRILEQVDFPGLEKRRGGTTPISLWITFKTSVVYLLALVVTLPLWLIPGMAIVVPVLLSAYLNKNIFVYDVLQDFASPEERQRLERENWGELYTLGIILGFLNYFPLAFVVLPTFASLAYSYFCLNALKELRSNET